MARRWLAALALAAILLCARSANNSKAYEVPGDYVSKLGPANNIGPHTVSYYYLLGGGAGNPPNLVMYIPFDFAPFAPTPSRFCAFGSPQFNIMPADAATLSATYSQITLDAPAAGWCAAEQTTVEWKKITWNNQPSLDSRLGTMSTATKFTPVGSFGAISMTAATLNAAVRFSTSRTGFRLYYVDNAIRNFNSYVQGTSYRPFISFDYLTCDPNATCNQSAGTCTCNAGFTGSGTSCRAFNNCAATTLSNAAFPLTNHGATGSGVCVSTFTGAPKSVCNDGTFGAVTGTQCTKITCPAYPSGPGSASYPLTNAGTTATGTCISGWYGTPKLACGVTGVWSSTPSPSCVQHVCAAETIGTASFPATLSLATATGTCASGFGGSPKSTCSASGTWGPVTSPCVAMNCPAQADAARFVSWPQTSHGVTATGTCNAGYSGAPTRLCSNGAWSSTVTGSCIRITCAAVTGYQNADWPLTNSGDSAAGTCVAGYSGSPARACSIEGVWSSTVNPTCIQNLCGAATDNNAVWPGNTPSLTSASGTCVPGYTGSPTRACNANGSWGAISNPCTQIFCSAGQLNNANWPSAAAGSNAVAGECVSGYSGPTARNCDIFGYWTNPSPSCTRIQCAATTEGNATWSLTDSLTLATGVCAAGFSGSPTRPCTADGTFGDIINPCTQIMCPPRIDSHASWVPVAAGSADVPGTCDPGWEGAPTRSCDIVGNWGTMSGECIQLQCAGVNDTDALAVWSTAYAGDMSVSGVCYPNTSGSPRRDCFYNGTWSDVLNPCSTNPCDALTNDYHANWPSPRDVNTVVNGTCVAGYKSTGTPTRLCKQNGQWDTVITNPCEPIYCTKDLPSYQPFFAEWPETIQAGYTSAGTCVAGYTGTTSRGCSLTAAWLTPSPLCTAIMCASIGNDGQQSSWPSTQAGQVATGTCFAGFEGSPTRTCSIEGQWETVTNPCTQKQCAARTEGDAEWPATLGGVTVSGTCKDGYYGTVSRSCSADGSWQPISGVCEQYSCPAETLNSVMWPSTSPGSVAMGSCVEGFGFSTRPTRACSASGSWEAAVGTCTRLRCSAVVSDNADWPQADSMTVGVRGTCVDGWQGAPLRNCSSEGIYSATSNPCIRTTCPAVDEGASGSWPQTDSGTDSVLGTCPVGSVGEPVRDCRMAGTWTGIVGSCTVLKCASGAFDNADWPETTAGSATAGTCHTGYAGSPSRECKLDGQWSAVNNSCTRLSCPAVEDGNAQWPLSPSISPIVSGTCNAGFSGSPSRECDEDGQWGAISNACAALYCPENTASDAVWSETLAGNVATGACREGTTGLPTRQCLLSGAWNSTIVNPCQIKYDDCPTESVGNTFFPAAEPGEVSIGRCPHGYRESDAGPPSRQCKLDGTWEEGFSNVCELIPVESNDNIANLTWTSKTSTSVVLAWNVLNSTGNVTFMAEVALGTSAFVVANLNTAINFKERTIEVKNLFPRTSYQFRITSGDENGYNTEGGAVISVETYITPASGLRLDEPSTDSLSLSWTASPHATYYHVYYREVVPSRAAADDFTLHSRVNSTDNTVAVIGDLESGRAYEVLILAGDANGEEQVGTRLVLTTLSTTDNVVSDPGLGTNGTIIAAASASAVVVLIVVIVVIVVISRRRQRRTDAKMDEFGGVGGLMALKSYRQTLARSQSSMSHADGKTHLSFADKTVVNTVAEIALPGFLLIDYATTVQPGERVDASTSATMYHATLLDDRLVQRAGSRTVVAIDYNDRAELTPKMNDELFHFEVSILWSLSFHPNVVGLLAYADEPRTILVREYAWDLPRFLAEAARPMPIEGILHLCVDIAQAVNAAHSLGVAHRAIESANIYVAPPSESSSMPVALLGHFSESRAEHTFYVRESAVNVRYAAPEVIVRIAESRDSESIEADQASDVYSLGVVMLEILSGSAPWGGISDASVTSAVKAGKGLQVVCDNDDVHSLALASVIQECVSLETDLRPLAAVVSARVTQLCQ